jgi:hypothetical protein
MILYVFDKRYYDVDDDDYFVNAGRKGVDYLVCDVTAHQSIPSVVRSILWTLSHAKQDTLNGIDCIRLATHGGPGHLSLGTGLTARNASSFERLAPYMNSDSELTCIEIHGCRVASDSKVDPHEAEDECADGTWRGDKRGLQSKGYKLLYALADAVGCRVTAGINCQDADSDWVIEGPTLTVFPDGSYIFEKIEISSGKTL